MRCKFCWNFITKIFNFAWTLAPPVWLCKFAFNRVNCFKENSFSREICEICTLVEVSRRGLSWRPSKSFWRHRCSDWNSSHRCHLSGWLCSVLSKLIMNHQLVSWHSADWMAWKRQRGRKRFVKNEAQRFVEEEIKIFHHISCINKSIQEIARKMEEYTRWKAR